MTRLFETASEIQTFLLERGWQYAFIGGIANLAWGRQRLTDDVDLTLLTHFQNEEKIVTELLSLFEPRIENAAQFALVNRVLLLKTHDNVGVDIGLGGFIYEESCVARSQMFDYGRGFQLRVISPEDLIIMKAFAGRMQDWADIEGVIARQHKRLDWDYILPALQSLAELKEDPLMVQQVLDIREQESD